MTQKPARWAWNPASLAAKWQSMSRGLVLLLPFWDNDDQHNLIDASRFDNSGATQKITDQGLGIGSFTTSNYLKLPAANVPDSLRFTGSYSFVVHFRSAFSSTRWQPLLVRGNSSGDEIEIYRNRNGNEILWVHNRNTSGTFDYVQTSAQLSSASAVNTLVGTYNGSTARMWLDGVEVGYAVGPEMVEDPADEGVDWWVGKSDEPVFGSNDFLATGTVFLAAVWRDTVLTDAEARLLGTDPYGLIRLVRRRSSVGVVTILLQAAPAAEAGVTANLETLALLEATPAGQSAVSAAFTIITQLAADIAAVGTVSGTLSTAAENLLAAIAAGSSTVTADLETLAELQATPAGQSAVSAILALVKELESNPTAVSSIAAALESTVTTSKGFTALSEALATTITISDE